MASIFLLRRSKISHASEKNDCKILEFKIVSSGNAILDRCICKIATAHGEKIGITSIKKVNSRGEEYITNMYDRDAQKFVLTHVIPQLCKLS